MHQAGLLLVDQRLEQLGHNQRLQLFVGLDQNASVGTNGHGCAQRFLALRHAARDGDLVKRVHAHLHIRDVHTRAVRLHP